MKSKRVKICLCLLAVMLLSVACNKEPKEATYIGDDRSIFCNILKKEVTLTNVDFYCSLTSENYTGKNGTFQVVSSFDQKDLMFQDKEGDVSVLTSYNLSTDKKLSSFPQNLKIYKNSSHTKYDTYAKEKVK